MKGGKLNRINLFNLKVVDFEILYGVVLLIIIILFNLKKLNKCLLMDKIIYITYYIYIIGVIGFVFFPIPIYLLKEEPLDYFNISYFINLNPMEIVEDFRSNYMVIVGNFILLTPLGIYCPILSTKKINLKNIFFIGLIITVFIEVVQLITSLIIGWPFRIFDIIDILSNLSGMIMGYFLLKLINPLVLKIVGKYEVDTKILIED